MGSEVLANYYDKYLHQWNKIVTVERNIRNVVVKGVAAQGQIRTSWNSRESGSQRSRL